MRAFWKASQSSEWIFLIRLASFANLQEEQLRQLANHTVQYMTSRGAIRLLQRVTFVLLEDVSSRKSENQAPCLKRRAVMSKFWQHLLADFYTRKFHISLPCEFVVGYVFKTVDSTSNTSTVQQKAGADNANDLLAERCTVLPTKLKSRCPRIISTCITNCLRPPQSPAHLAELAALEELSRNSTFGMPSSRQALLIKLTITKYQQTSYSQ